MQDRLPQYQSAIWITRSPHELATIWEQFVDGTAQVVRALRGESPPVRVLNAHVCGWCDHKSLCMAELKSHDAAHIMANEYTQKYIEAQ
jgi:hypothetical protein